MVKISFEDDTELIERYDIGIRENNIITEKDLVIEMSDYTYKLIGEVENEESNVRAIEDKNGVLVYYRVDENNNLVEVWVEY